MRRTISILLFCALPLMSSCATQTPLVVTEEQVSEKVTITGAVGSIEQLTIKGPDEYPSGLSPDSRWLLLNVTDTEKNKVIFKLDLQNRSKVVITSKSSNSTGGAWFPDMSSIVYSNDRSGRSVIVQSLGVSGEAGVRFVTQPALGNSLFPDVSVDGKDIAFSIFTNVDDNQIAMIDSTGTNLRVYGSGWSPQFSPDSKTLAFVQKTGEQYHICTMSSSNGSNLIQLTSGDSMNVSATWSPDGRKLAFVSTRSGKHRHLFVMDSSGQNVVQLTEGNFDVSNPKWGKDGYLYFAANAGSNWDVWRLKPKSIL